jgi:hypothetical protein
VEWRKGSCISRQISLIQLHISAKKIPESIAKESW